MALSVTEKRELLARKLAEKAARERRDVPLSYGQEALWFLQQQVPESAAYNTAFTVRIRSAVDVGVMRRALRKLVARHEALRTVFPLVEGRPVQAVYGYREAEFEQIFVGEIVRGEVEAVYQRPFDLENEPLFRAHLFTAGETDHLLLLCFHHVICDAWAIWVIANELGVLLEAEQSGAKVSLPAAASYEQFVAWQQEVAQRPELEGYWTKQMGGEIPSLDMPLDKARPKHAAAYGASHFFEVDEELFGKVKARAQEMGVTPFMFLLAAYQVLLYRYTGQEDVVVGSPTTGRSKADFASMVGYLVNAIPLRANLSGEPTFAAFVQQVRETVIGGLKHQDYPLPLLVQKLPVQRGSSGLSLFQAFFVYQKPQMAVDWVRDIQLNGRGEWGGWQVEPYEIAQMEGQFDLHLEVTEQTDELRAVLKYNPELWEAGTMARFAGHWLNLIAGAVERPEAGIGELPLMDEDELRQIVVEFNDTGREYDAGGVCLHELFEAQVEKTPDKIAVRFRDEALSYAELNGQANVLAGRLRTLGVGRNVLVGVCMERSLEMVVALYGVLKAGGAYVPIDPTYPAERVGFMVEDSGVGVLLVQEGLRGRLPETDASIVNCELRIVNCELGGNLGVEVSSDDLAYMIYTSGSTGRPKGAMNGHGGIVNRLLWMQEAYGLTADDVVLQKTPFSFDVSVWEFFWPLMVGAELVVAEPEGHKDGRYLTEVIQEAGVTTMHFVPSMLDLFLRERGVEGCVSLRRVICSGEALAYELTERFFERLDCELHNLYGPTEAAIDVTYWQCVRDDARRVVPIGRPVANTQMYIVDKHNRPVPVGVAGELLIGGVQVGKGYWKRPELTAERFVDVSGVRYQVSGEVVGVGDLLPTTHYPLPTIYRTGDLARWRPDGVIEYLGRIDFQVKVRGFRVELGEVEAVVVGHPAVVQAVVVARQDSGGGHLVGYVVTNEAITADALRGFVRQSLPEQMVPTHVVFLDEVPLSPNGKVNRKGLPEPEVKRAESVAFVRPEGVLEEQIVSIWQDVLGVERIGRGDNFFDLGGHSLLLAQVRSKLEAVVGRDLPMVALFEHPTVGALAGYLEKGAEKKEEKVKEQVARGVGRRERLAGMRKRRGR